MIVSQGVRLMVVGDSCLDVYVRGRVERCSPEAPVPVLLADATIERAVGGAAHAARCAVELGASTHLVSVVGDDPDGARLRDALQDSRMKYSSLATANDRPTTTKTRYLVGDHQLLRVDRELRAPVSKDIESELIWAIHLGPRPDAVLISDYAWGVVTGGVVEACCSFGVPVVADPKRVDLAHYSGATVIKPNAAELARSGHGAEHWRQQTGATLVVTRGAAGAEIWPHGTSHRLLKQSPPARPGGDAIGAGDAFAAALAIALGGGAELEVAVSYACRVGSAACGRRGTSPPTLEDVAEASGGGMEGWVTTAELRSLVGQWRNRGQTVAVANGCFDRLHSGHRALLSAASKVADRLVVLVDDNDSVRKLKGIGRPFNDISVRVAALTELSEVDAVAVFQTERLNTELDFIQPDVLVKGNDRELCDIVGRHSARRVLLVPRLPGISTTQEAAE